MDQLIEATHRAEAEHFWFRGFRAFVRVALEEATRSRPPGRILDCGCGTGAALATLEPFGRPYGFDLNALGLSIARRSGRTRIARASVAAIPFGSGAFDIITSFDVLQSLPDAVEPVAVAEMFRVLRPGGALVVNVAALDVLFGNHCVLAEDLRRYDRHRLRSLIEGAGFVVERLTFTNAALFPMILFVRTAQRLAGLRPPEKAHGEIAVPPRPINSALAALLALEARLLRRVNMPIGSSLLCIARKPGGRD